MESTVVALGTLLTLAMIVVRVLWQERSICKHAVGRSLTVASVTVTHRAETQRAAASTIHRARTSFPPSADDAVPSTLRSRR